MQVEIVHARSNKPLTSLKDIETSNSVLDLKKAIARENKKFKDVNRQELRLEPKGKFLKDDEILSNLGINDGSMLYFKDRGLQIGWTTVFLSEYAGPLFVYGWIYTRPWLFYGDMHNTTDHSVVNIAMACWSFHYLKRLFETVFVHRFSNATMPISNLFKNCSYYWGFAAYVSYHVNHPLYTSPGRIQIYSALAAFFICELGNLSIHIALRNLRPEGSKVRKIPFPTSNPLTCLFNFVSCPNYTYEVGSWIAFSVMTQCLPAGLFAFAGFYQMTAWAFGKHRNYKKEFPAYPKGRKSIVPFLL
uniref:very-long-chain enoyl-CoA reductase n=1 Tax=Lepeophtheirus salmonis TaxID=72036 RepID=A0A0K2TWN1_LEPSM